MARPGMRSAAAAVIVVALLPAWPAQAGTRPPARTQTCPLPLLGADPDTVTLTGPATLRPADHRLVGYTLAVSETPGEKGDGLPHGVTVSYSVTSQVASQPARTSGAVPAAGAASGDFQVAVHFRLRAAHGAGGQSRVYTVSWKASFDGGPHVCSSTDAGRHPFLVEVPAARRR